MADRVEGLQSLPSWLLSKTSLRGHRLIHAGLRAEGFTGYEFRVLASLAEVGELSQADVGRLVALDRRDVTHTVRTLEERGIVERRAHPTLGRVMLVKLSRRGLSAFRRLEVVMDRLQAELLAPLTAQERDQLIGLLSKLQVSSDLSA